MTTTVYVCVYDIHVFCDIDRNCGNPTPDVRYVGVTGGCGQEMYMLNILT